MSKLSTLLAELVLLLERSGFCDNTQITETSFFSTEQFALKTFPNHHHSREGNVIESPLHGNPATDLIYVLAELNRLFKDKASRDSSQ